MNAIRAWIKDHPRTVTTFLAITVPIWMVPMLLYSLASIVYMSMTDY